MTVLGFEFGVLSFEFADKAGPDVAPRKTQNAKLKTQN